MIFSCRNCGKQYTYDDFRYTTGEHKGRYLEMIEAVVTNITNKCECEKGEDKMKNILFARENETVIIPSKREEDGAFDIYANFEQDYMVIQPHETVMVPTGLRSAFSSDYVAILKERGSTGSKGIGQRAGVIDSGYRGLWFVPLTNHNDNPIVILKNKYNMDDLCISLTGRVDVIKKYIEYPYEKAIAQVIMAAVPKLSIKEATVDEIMSIKSERGEGALGSSSK